MKLNRHSPSSLSLFAASPAKWVLERCLGFRGPGSAKMSCGTAVEAGVAYGLTNQDADPQEAVNMAEKRYRALTALSGDQDKESVGKDVAPMVLRALTDLRPYGVPDSLQDYVEWKPEGLRFPIVGYHDFGWSNHGLIVDLKTTRAMPSEVKVNHAMQVSLYTGGGNLNGAVAYVTPKKSIVYTVENARQHRDALHIMALAVERFMALEDDPRNLVRYVVPDLDHMYLWKDPETRAAAFEVWKI